VRLDILSSRERCAKRAAARKDNYPRQCSEHQQHGTPLHRHDNASGGVPGGTCMFAIVVTVCMLKLKVPRCPYLTLAGGRLR
jgi:hypothetical protein